MIIASLASYAGPGREQSLPVAVRSLLPQVDRLYIYYNGKMCPELYETLAHDQIEIVEGEVNWGSCGKFVFPSRLRAGYVLTCDDDILYPPDYAERIVAAVDRYQCPVGYHGSVVTPPLTSYYRQRTHQVRFHDAQPTDVPVNLLGTGVMAYRIEHLPEPLTMAAFQTTNMADPWFAVWCHTHQVRKMMALAHDEGWLLTIPYTRKEDTLWWRMHHDDSVQTRILNQLAP
jgi:hypothetical protein